MLPLPRTRRCTAVGKVLQVILLRAPPENAAVADRIRLGELNEQSFLVWLACASTLCFTRWCMVEVEVPKRRGLLSDSSDWLDWPHNNQAIVENVG